MSSKFFFGLILGIIIASGITYYLNHNSAEFSNRLIAESSNLIANSSAPIILTPGINARHIQNASATANEESNYDFYDILQGKKISSEIQNTNKLKNNDEINKITAHTKSIIHYYLQIGVFINPNSASDIKARLALLGFSTLVKTEIIKTKTINRVLMGPYIKYIDALNQQKLLTQNNIITVIIKN